MPGFFVQPRFSLATLAYVPSTGTVPVSKGTTP